VDAIPIDDRGLLLGDGLFETLLADHGELDAFDAHAERMVRGCAVLGLPAPETDRLRVAALAILDERSLTGERAAVRLTWTAGSGGRGLERPPAPQPRLLAQAAPAPLPAGPARLATVAIRRNAASPTSRLKTLAYLDNVLARREALAAGADEALMLNTDGELCGAAAANLFWIVGGRLHTPALACGVLDGIMRGQVLAAAARLGVEAVEAHVGMAILEGAEAVFLTNSLIGLRAVAAIDGRAVPGNALIDRLDGARHAPG
jgi:branched-subunit amino acid aminotransferase/4-amino-4-deoxychorismate lyase